MLSTVFTPFCTMIVTIPIAFIVLAPIGNEIGTLIANALFGLADLGGIGILIVMAVLGAFWQLFVVCGMHMPSSCSPRFRSSLPVTIPSSSFPPTALWPLSGAAPSVPSSR